MAMNLENVKVIDINEAEKHTEQPSYYSVIPANVRYDSDLSPYAILLYGEITALTHKNGYCYASNTYFAKRYNRTPQAVSKWINQLSDKGYINVVYCRCKNIIVERRIYITSEVSTTVDRVSTPVDEGINQELIGYQQRIKENNKYNNKTNNKISEVDTSDFPEDPNEIKTKKATRSKKPSKTELNEQYISTLSAKESAESQLVAELLITYLKPLQPTMHPETHLRAWQVEFAKFMKENNISYDSMTRVINFAFASYWKKCTFAAKNIIDNYGKIYQQMTTNPKSDYQKRRESDMERGNMNTGNKNYKLY